MRKRIKLAADPGRWSLGLLAALSIGLLGGRAEAAPIPVTMPGQILNVPGGQYELVADLVCPAGLNLQIVADGIQFDGKGHTLTGPGAAVPPKSIGIQILGTKGVGVRNVSLRGFSIGVRVIDAEATRIYEVRATANIYGIQFHQTHHSSIVAGNFSDNNFGMLVGFSNNNVITHNVVMDNTLTDPAWTSGFSGGIFVASAENNLIADNAIHRNGNMGIWLYFGAHSNTIRSNAITRGKYDGIDSYGTDNTIVANTILWNPQYGIALAPGSTGQTVQSNRVLGNMVRDMLDENLPACLNTWLANTFVTDNETGINFGPGVGCIQ